MSQEARRRNAEHQRREQAGEAAEGAPDLENPRFSRGEERGPDTPAKRHVGRYSEGLEAEPEDVGGKEHVGRFDQGQDWTEGLADPLHVGRFSEGVEAEEGKPAERGHEPPRGG
jgi:hypothetical protein